MTEQIFFYINCLGFFPQQFKLGVNPKYNVNIRNSQKIKHKQELT